MAKSDKSIQDILADAAATAGTRKRPCFKDKLTADQKSDLDALTAIVSADGYSGPPKKYIAASFLKKWGITGVSQRNITDALSGRCSYG